MGGRILKITVDTNVLVRAVLKDDAEQSLWAAKILAEASLIAISLPCLCEFVWVLLRGAHLPKEKVIAAVTALLDAENVVVNRPAVEVGLSILTAGGDFADGVMAYEGSWLGGEIFVSFDKKAVSLLQTQGQSCVAL